MNTEVQTPEVQAGPDPLKLAFPDRLKLYLSERFPPVSHTALIVTFFYSGYLLAEFANPQQTLPLLNMRTLIGFFTVLLSFFMLRLFDEFKDYELDVVAHPERVVSRGIISLGELRIMLMLVIAATFLVNVIMGWHILLLYALVFVFALLMRYEFFVREWLIKDIFIYALTHQGIIPLYCLYIFGFSVYQHDGSFGLPFWLYAILSVGTCLGFEISRKTRSPDQEKELVDSYSKRFGMRGAATVSLALQMMAGVAALYLGIATGFALSYTILVLAACGATIAGTIQFLAGPNARTAKGLNVYASVFLLLLYIFIIVAVFSTRGVQVLLAW